MKPLEETPTTEEIAYLCEGVRVAAKLHNVARRLAFAFDQLKSHQNKVEEPVWTTTFPTEVGWYWWRKYPTWEPRVEHVYATEYGLHMNGWGVEKQGGEWSGPIARPEEK